jgi:hypothetical protein
LEELKALHERRKILLPDNMPPSPKSDDEKLNGDIKMTDPDDTQEEIIEEGSEEAEGSDDDVPTRRSLRRGGDRAAERQRKREEEEEARRKKEAELAAKAPKQSKEFIRLLKDISKVEETVKECEDEIATLDNDLREADCGRTRVLGKDRFWNRYYWFERNGMPYAGLPTSSTAHAGYANGCIWVQGPDDLEREGYIDMPAEFQSEYKQKFHMSVPQRKRMEEGRTSVFNARQWGYYAEPAEVEALLNWLDPRGFNELKLRKELILYRDKIVANMEARAAYLGLNTGDGKGDDVKTRDKKEEEVAVEEKPQKDNSPKGKRMSTRGTKRERTVTPDLVPELPAKRHRCLDWTNTMMMDEAGHVHSEEPPPPVPAKGRKAARKSR